LKKRHWCPPLLFPEQTPYPSHLSSLWWRWASVWRDGLLHGGGLLGGSAPVHPSTASRGLVLMTDCGVELRLSRLTAWMSMALGFMMGDSCAGGPHPHPGRWRHRSPSITETDPDPHDLNSWDQEFITVGIYVQHHPLLHHPRKQLFHLFNLALPPQKEFSS
jgi:hypothetical protein